MPLFQVKQKDEAGGDWLVALKTTGRGGAVGPGTGAPTATSLASTTRQGAEARAEGPAACTKTDAFAGQGCARKQPPHSRAH
jgi:hypothetical protein